MTHEYQYMVDFTLPTTLPEEFLHLIPHQRAKVNKLFREGKLVNYALSLDHAKMWAIFNANNETDVMDLIEELPLTRFMQIRISMLTFFNSVTSEAPVFSLN